MTESAGLQYLFIDLDDTVYPPGNGLWRQISSRIDEYMRQRLGLSADQVAARRAAYVAAHGTTLTGLMQDFDVDAAEYLEFVHRVDYSSALRPDARLRAALLSCPQSKAIFTNASRSHAERVLSGLGLDGVFDDIIDIVSLGYVNKPLPEAYRRAIELVGSPPAGVCLMADDRPMNLAPARQMGMTTVLVGSDVPPGFDHHVPLLADLPAAVPQLFEFKQAPEAGDRG